MEAVRTTDLPRQGKWHFPISRLMETPLTFDPGIRIEEVKMRLREGEPINAIVVVRNQRPVGLVMSLHMDKILSHQFGVSLYYKQAVSRIMDPSPLMVDRNTPLETVAHLAMDRERSKIYDHIIVTGQGLLQGTVSVQQILIALATLQQKRAAELSQTNHRLQGEIAERSRMEVKLRALNTEIERSNQDLQDFTYTVSHDLQEPLRKIHTFGHFLEEDYGHALTEEALDYIHRMQAAAIRMKNLIQHLLSISRVGTHGKKLKPVQPRDVIDKTLETLSERIDTAPCKIQVQEELPMVLADDIQLEQLFQNIIGNALKFMPESRIPSISIHGQVDRDMAAFSIRDNGIGIEDRYLEKIFGIFQRLHHKDQYEGTGVGLALCKKIVQRHGGRIWVESQQGKGTTVHFTLKKSSGIEGNPNEQA